MDDEHDPPLQAALERWVWTRDRGQPGTEQALPDNPGPVHAVDYGRQPQPRFLDRPFTAQCGARVHVVLPGVFNAEDPDACRRCALSTPPTRPNR